MSTTVTWKIVCCRCLTPPIPFQDGLKYSPCSTEWIDVPYKHICGNTLTVRSHSFMMKARALGDGNGLLKNRQ